MAAWRAPRVAEEVGPVPRRVAREQPWERGEEGAMGEAVVLREEAAVGG